MEDGLKTYVELSTKSFEISLPKATHSFDRGAYQSRALFTSFGGQATRNCSNAATKTWYCLVLLEDQPLRMVTSGGYGYTIGNTIAYGYLPEKSINGHKIEIDVDCKKVSATLRKNDVAEQP